MHSDHTVILMVRYWREKERHRRHRDRQYSETRKKVGASQTEVVKTEFEYDDAHVALLYFRWKTPALNYQVSKHSASAFNFLLFHHPCSIELSTIGRISAPYIISVKVIKFVCSLYVKMSETNSRAAKKRRTNVVRITYTNKHTDDNGRTIFNA